MKGVAIEISGQPWMVARMTSDSAIAPRVTAAAPTDADADRLAADLRAPGPDRLQPATLPRWVTGPVVILDSDRGDVRVACGADAVDSARAWGASITDPAQPAPTCHIQ